MKNLGLVLLFLFAFSTQAEERALLLGGDYKIGFFGGPTLKMTSIVDSQKFLIGGHGAILFNQHIYLGGGGGGTARDVGDGFSSYSYGGAYFGSFIFPNQAIHYFADVGIYAGNLSRGGSGVNVGNNAAEDFLIIEPNVGVAFNILKHAKLLFGISYKIIDGVQADDLSNSDVGGVSLNGQIVFGVF